MLTLVSDYTYDVSINVEELEMFDNPSLVFRIETEGVDVFYQWMVAVEVGPIVTVMDYILDLTPYAGRSLSVSYAFATTRGISDYSQSVPINLPGIGYSVKYIIRNTIEKHKNEMT